MSSNEVTQAFKVDEPPYVVIMARSQLHLPTVHCQEKYCMWGVVTVNLSILTCPYVSHNAVAVCTGMRNQQKDIVFPLGSIVSDFCVVSRLQQTVVYQDITGDGGHRSFKKMIQTQKVQLHIYFTSG